MTASDWVVIIAAISLGVVQALGICVQIVTAWRASDKVSQVATTLEKVHVDTNGNLTKMAQRLEAVEKALVLKTDELYLRSRSHYPRRTTDAQNYLLAAHHPLRHRGHWLPEQPECRPCQQHRHLGAFRDPRSLHFWLLISKRPDKTILWLHVIALVGDADARDATTLLFCQVRRSQH
jgi:hypothetical protein